MAAENVFPKSGGDISFASDANYFYQPYKWTVYSHPGVTATAVLGHSATAWTAVSAAATVITADTGASWAAATADNANMTGASAVCVADRTRAIVFDHNANNVSFTTDSGDNWSAGTAPTNATLIFDVSYPTAAVAVAALDLGTATRGIWISANGGNTWTECTSGPAQDVEAVAMFDASFGLAISTDNKIWRTSDGGDNWTDTGETVAAITSNDGSLVITDKTGDDATWCLRNTATVSTGVIDMVDGGGDTAQVTRLTIPTDGTTNFITNSVLTTNGNLYFVVTKDGAVPCSQLWRSADNGITWGSGPIAVIGDTPVTTNFSHSLLSEYASNKLLCLSSTGTEIATLDLSGDFT